MFSLNQKYAYMWDGLNFTADMYKHLDQNKIPMQNELYQPSVSQQIEMKNKRTASVLRCIPSCYSSSLALLSLQALANEVDTFFR